MDVNSSDVYLAVVQYLEYTLQSGIMLDGHFHGEVVELMCKYDRTLLKVKGIYANGQTRR